MNATKTILLCAAVSAVAGCTTEPATGPGKTETAEMPATGLPIREGPFEYPVEASDFAAATPERLRKEVWDRINADLAAFWPNRPWRDQEEARLAALGASRGDGVDLTALAPDSGMRIGASLQCAAVPDGWPEADIAFGFVLALTKTIDGSTPGYDLHAAETLLARGYSTLPRGKRPFPYISKEQLADVVRATWAADGSADGVDRMVLREAIVAERELADAGIADYMDSLKDNHDAVTAGGAGGSREFKSKYDVVYVNRKKAFFSYRIEFYAYTGGAHGSEAIFTGTVDSGTMRKLSVADAIPEDKRDEALGRIRKAVADRIGGEDRLLRDVALTENFCVAEDGLHFVFRECEIAAYSHGTIEVVIPAYGKYAVEPGE